MQKGLNPNTTSNKPRFSLKIVLFDDSTDAHFRFIGRMKNLNILLKTFMRPNLGKLEWNQIIDFKPNLIIIDLLFRGDITEGFGLIKKIHNLKDLKKIPLIVCSKYINESHSGKILKEKVISMPGVVAAFGKIPDYPLPKELLLFIKE